MFEERYMGGAHLEHNPEWHTDESPWKVRHITRLLQANSLNPKTIGEVGCGFGEVLMLLQKEKSEERECWGYEISPVAFQYAQKRAHARLHFQMADLTKEPEVFFDLLLVLDVVEHVADYLGFLQQIRSKGQYKILQVPLELSAQTVLRRGALLKQRHIMGHLHYFTKETLLSTLEDCGYKILDYIYTSSSLELPTHVLSTRLMRGPRRLCSLLNKDLAARLLGGYRLMVLTR